MSSSRLVLGVDPGSRVTGFGIIETDGRQSRYVESGCLRLDTDLPVAQRLGAIFEGLVEVIRRTQPRELAIEEVFLSKNASSALKLGQARGAAICAAVTQGLAVSEYAARLVKQSVVGTGAADKEQVQHMVTLMLKPPHKLAADEADALAVALAHANALLLNSRLKSVGGRR